MKMKKLFYIKKELVGGVVEWNVYVRIDIRSFSNGMVYEGNKMMWSYDSYQAAKYMLDLENRGWLLV